MNMNLLNLALRFMLETAALITMMLWGWAVGEQMGAEWLQYVLAISVPLIAAFLWGAFNVPDDPSRSGNAPVVVPGVVRLAFELLFFSLAAWMLRDLGHGALSGLFTLLVIGHYLFSFHRISWLLARWKVKKQIE